MLLRNLRATKMQKSLPKNAPIWWQNTPQKHGFDRAHLERIMMLDGSKRGAGYKMAAQHTKIHHFMVEYVLAIAIRCAYLTCNRSEVEGEHR